MASIANLLYRLLKKDQPWAWSDIHTQAFDTLKMKLATAPILINYDPKLTLKLACDASSFGLGAVLSDVLPDKSERPIAFSNHMLNAHEKNYSQLDKEGDSIIFGLKKYHQYLFGRKFRLTTDNRTLKYLFAPSRNLLPIASSRLTR